MTDPWCCYINANMNPINIPQMLAYIPYMEPTSMGHGNHGVSLVNYSCIMLYALESREITILDRPWS